MSIQLRYTPIHSTIHVSPSDAVDTHRYTPIHTDTLHNTCISIGRCRYTPIHTDTHRYTPIHTDTLHNTCITIGRCRYAPIHANTRSIHMYHDRALSIRSDTREYTSNTAPERCISLPRAHIHLPWAPSSRSRCSSSSLESSPCCSRVRAGAGLVSRPGLALFADLVNAFLRPIRASW